MLIWFLDSMFLLLILLIFIYMIRFKFLKFEANHQCCIGFVSEGCLSIEVMPVNIGQSRVKIGNFHICSLHSIVKLHLNLFNLLFSMFLVSFYIIAITSCFITKFQIILYLTTLYLFLCDFIPFLSIFIPYGNFNHI